MYSRYSGEVFNLGNPTEHSVLEMANMIKKLTGSKSRFKYLPLPENDPKKRRPDTSKATEKLKWKPVVSLEKGLTRMIKYYS